jgi:hypothetical protein
MLAFVGAGCPKAQHTVLESLRAQAHSTGDTAAFAHEVGLDAARDPTAFGEQ